MTDKYILGDDGRTCVQVADLLVWAKWIETAERRVGCTDLPNGARVTTIFLGLDYRRDLTRGTPLLFETLVRGGPLDRTSERCSTFEQAEKQHASLVERAS